MPPARSAAAARHAPRVAPRTPQRHRERPRPVAFRGPLSRVRWDRLARIAMLLTLTIVAFLYAQHILSYFSTRAQAVAERTLVQNLARQNRALRAQQRSLESPATIEQQARRLGMVKAGERSYAITGLPAAN